MDGFCCLTLEQVYGPQLKQAVLLDPNVVNYDELRYLKVLHIGYDGCPHQGELIVHHTVAKEVLEIFQALYEMSYPIEKMRLMNCYDGDDEWSMTDNNSSAFNFRYVTGDGGKKYSKHAYGLAIDLNPRVNPYIKGEIVLPKNGLPYINRDQHALGMIKKDDAVYRLFKQYGWIYPGSRSFLDFYLRLNNTLSLVICEVVSQVVSSFGS